jgi:SAM-dependent methyltransferase
MIGRLLASAVRRLAPGQVRRLPPRLAEHLPPGAEHYRAYVGPPSRYDLMGACQFALLVALGLRGRYRVLDFGCGSLRLGRLLIPYLERGGYHGLEPNQWLVEEGLRRELGKDIRRVKRPRFHDVSDFQADRCGTGFDFIIAQSIFSHTGPRLMAKALAGFRRALHPRGLAVFTVVHRANAEPHTVTKPDAWVYPEVVRFSEAEIQALLAEAGLHGRRIPWRHPGQVWYVASRSRSRLPPPDDDVDLRGAILGVPTWRPSPEP